MSLPASRIYSIGDDRSELATSFRSSRCFSRFEVRFLAAGGLAALGPEERVIWRHSCPRRPDEKAASSVRSSIRPSAVSRKRPINAVEGGGRAIRRRNERARDRTNEHEASARPIWRTSHPDRRKFGRREGGRTKLYEITGGSNCTIQLRSCSLYVKRRSLSFLSRSPASLALNANSRPYAQECWGVSTDKSGTRPAADPPIDRPIKADMNSSE